ncbi:MAG: JAB domain-containing protein [Candidatus Nanohaloarchaea archaeon]
MEYRLGNIKVQAEIRDNPDNKIQTPNDVTTQYQKLGEQTKEHLYAIFLNASNEVLGDKLIALGNHKQAPLDTQDIARTAVLVNAAAVILVHNHPSNKAEATQEDVQATRNVQQALDPLSIDLLDHLIITRNQAYSMKAHRDKPFHEEGGNR